MAIEVKGPNYALSAKATYVTVNGAGFAILRANAWFDQSGSWSAPAPHDNPLSVLLGNPVKGSGKFYGVKTAKHAFKQHPPVCHSAVHRATYYPADQVTLTVASRKKLRAESPAPRKTGRGKVGVGGMRTRSHN
ncbi:conserved hypothetical protein [Paraburkholderia piptadeniae]|uniref:Uncharacterized protein n=1 Tax=Paraburkholderia piptadeniae TaxID=1701573 RepID=A0A1N7SE38_9BURK|nr:hypothetical protein [Paraburkholderia piptadeniae]SIT45592.1 conserved hypothetical protein [Paraburkholderia piptadeniae]